MDMWERATNHQGDIDDIISINRRAAYSILYYQTISMEKIEGPFFTTVQEAIDSFNLGAGSRDSELIQTPDEET
jgi:hypothetical protein